MYAETYQTKEGNPSELRVFDTITELVDHGTIANRHTADQITHLNDRSFVGRRFDSLDHVRKESNERWDEGLEVLDKMLGDLADTNLPSPKSRKRKLRFDETDGDEADYDRLRCGQPFWRTTRRQSTHGPATITIIVDVAANCYVRHQDILWRGAAAVAMTDILENAGYRVALWAVARTDKTYTDECGVTIAYCAKDHSDPVDRSTLINAVSGWFFRSVIFGEICQSPNDRVPRSSLGRSRAPNEADMDKITNDQVRVLISDAFTYERAVEKVRTAIQQMN